VNFPAIYPILDASFLPSDETRASTLHALVCELAEASIGILQYRNKQGNEHEVLTDAQAMKAAAKDSRIKLILNDWPHLAVETGFDGVHVGQEDISPAEARAIVGSNRIVGVSTHNKAQLQAADREPVDYIAIGPVFATTTKQNPDPVVGLEGVRHARSLTRKPLIAIGGITLATAADVKAAGADSIALISAIFSSTESPAKSAAEFLRVFH
jgi:thiamine-phosphate pyrophosphorylase